MVTFLNPAAKQLSGWTGDQGLGQPLDLVFAITNARTGEIVENPATRVLREGSIGALAMDTVLTSKDGRVIPVGATEPVLVATDTTSRG